MQTNPLFIGIPLPTNACHSSCITCANCHSQGLLLTWCSRT
jgi:hypothetical protein